MPKIFISHIHEDSLVASHLVEFLQKKLEVSREHVFTSSDHQIDLGSDWMRSIADSLSRATVIIALFSSDAARRQWVHFEAGAAWAARNKLLIPLCIGGLKPADLGKPYANIQGADLHDRATAEYLINTIIRALRPEMKLLPRRELRRDDRDVRRLLTGLEQWASRSEKALQN